MRIHDTFVCAMLLAVAACGVDERADRPLASGAETGATAGGGPVGGSAGAGPGGGGTASAGDGGSAGPGSTGGIKFDVGAGGTGAGDGGAQMGCEKVDFLFVVDNSGSMQDEQQNLANSFPGFIATIQQTLMAKDYHLIVVDTDAASLSFNSLTCNNGVCTCDPEPQCCLGMCYGNIIQPPPTTCAGKPCSDYELPMGCDVTLGAGKVTDPIGNDCGITSGKRYMLDDQPDLSGTFACVAKVGAGGDGNELVMQAMMEAVGTQNDPGQCNEGFLRDDAILVVTFITDEEEDGKSPGDPASWKQFLVDKKNGNEEAIVMLGIVGDPDVPNGVCANGGDADPSPILRGFAESFTHGQWGSVCAPDYAPFFTQAVSVIDAACDDFVPPA